MADAPVPSLPLPVAILVAVVCQAICYGIFLVLFGACCYVLLHKKKTSTTNYAFLATAIVMFILITINFAVSWSRIMDAFFVVPDATAYLGDLTQWKEVFRTGAYIALTAVADTLFIYRLYMVWSRNIWVCILPIVLLCGSLTSGIGIEVAIASLKGSGLFATGIAAWATSFFSISLAQNLLTTFLIVFRIWRVNLGAGNMTNNSLWPVIAVILESGSIYSATLLCLLSTYASGSFAQYICLDMLVPIIGCTFCLIIVRVGLGLTKNASNNGVTAISDVGRTTIGGTNARYPMRKINISVGRTVAIDEEAGMERGKEDSDMGDEPFDKMRDLSYDNGATNAF